MGPFTEALIHALNTSVGPITEVFEAAASTAREISPGQEPVLYHSKSFSRVALSSHTAPDRDARAKELLRSAERLYSGRAWDEFRVVVQRAKALASDVTLVERLSHEMEFAAFAMTAADLEKSRNWSEAAEQWQKAFEHFPRREWTGMNASVAWLLGDNPSSAVRILAMLSSQSDSDISRQARQMLGEMTKAFPELLAEAQRASRVSPLGPGLEFERFESKGVSR
jgi:hypothetical protein